VATRCPKCQAENPDTPKFCGDCGTRLSSHEGASDSMTKTVISPAADGNMVARRYKILGKLELGGMGVVYKAEDTRLKRTVALKFLPPELCKDSEANERFLRKAHAAAALSHPNICTIHKVDEEGGTPFISMEYVEGQSVRERIRKGPLDVMEALGIAMQTAQGFEEAHKKGV
jgi:serine/threonine protein kinase